MKLHVLKTVDRISTVKPTRCTSFSNFFYFILE